MIIEISLLVTLVKLIDRIPVPLARPKRSRGRPCTYDDRLFLKALVVMIVKHLRTVNELRTVLEQPTSEMQRLRQLFTVNGRYPTRRTWERRMAALPATLPDQIAALGGLLVELIQPFGDTGRAVAIDSTVLRAKGAVWHKRDRAAGRVPHKTIDTAAHWTKSGWHGWVYGWKLHIVTTVASVWIPLAAHLTPANTPDDVAACSLIERLPAEVRYVLGDTHYNRKRVHWICQQTGRIVVASRAGKRPHKGDGVAVRKIFHQLRTHTIENFNEQFKGIFEAHAQVPTKGLSATQGWALGSILVYQLALLYRHENQQDLRVGLKAFLKAA